MGFGWVRSLHPDDREAFLDERSKAMAEGREFIREFRVVTPQGETRWLSVHTTPLLSQEGASNTRVGTLADITERKQAEESDRQLHAEHVRANELRHMVRILEQMAATLAQRAAKSLGRYQQLRILPGKSGRNRRSEGREARRDHRPRGRQRQASHR